MLPKSKLNHSESTSLNNLNSVNNMMINYSQSKLSTQNATTGSDDRYGCRALICDSNGIIIGETAYRCMICAKINDSIAETKQHYYEQHSNELLPGLSANNLSNSQNHCATNGNNLTNSILLNQSLNSSLSNDLLNATNSFQQQHNSNSFLNNNQSLSAKKRKNVANVLDKICGIKKGAFNKNQQNSASLIQPTGSSLNQLSNYLASSQLSNQLNSLANLTNFNQLANEEYDEDDLDDQKSDLDQDEWMRSNNSVNNINLTNELINANSNAAILDALNKSNLYMKLNESINDNMPQEVNSKKLSKTNNMFTDNSIDPEFSNSNIYDNMMNLSSDSENKEDLTRTMPPSVKLKRGSTTATVGKPGHVNCAVCGVLRYYSCVYRRYGQFTCQVCYRFFRTFFTKPHQFTCTSLGKCPLDVRVRCRACWIHACINLYSVDGERKQILEKFRPLNKAADDSSKKDFNNNNVGDKSHAIKHNLDDLEDDRHSKKLKRESYVDEQYSNDDLIEEEDLNQDEDQEQPLNYSNTKSASEDDDNLREDDES